MGATIFRRGIDPPYSAAKVYRERLEGRLRKNSYVLQKQENPSEERRNFMTALTIGKKIPGHRWPCSFPARYRISANCNCRACCLGNCARLEVTNRAP